jgi:hypothetical protein
LNKEEDMAIPPDPTSDLTPVGTQFIEPILTGENYGLMQETYTVCLKTFPANTLGPGGIRVHATLANAVQMLYALAAIWPVLTAAQQEQFQAQIPNLCGGIPGRIVDSVNFVASYLTALETRDAFLQNALTGIMGAVS